MSDWQNFYLQKMGTDIGGTAYPVYESVSQWGIFCKEIPFIIMSSVKEPAKHTWYDEHGDDEFVSSDGLYLEAYTMTVEFACKKILSGSKDSSLFDVTVNDVRSKVGAFITWLRQAGMMKLYSSHTRIGRQYVRLQSVDDKATWKSDANGEWLIFSVKFKVNDPVTDITLSTQQV